jgi:hypothetical protein
MLAEAGFFLNQKSGHAVERKLGNLVGVRLIPSLELCAEFVHRIQLCLGTLSIQDVAKPSTKGSIVPCGK